MSKVLTDQIEKRTGGTAIDVPAAGKWPQGNIADNAIGASQMADDAVGVAELSATGTASATTFLRGDNAWTAVDTSGINANKEDIALLAFRVAANGSLAKYNLVDQSVDAFESSAGVDAGTSTGEYYSSAGKYWSGSQAADWITEDRNSGDNLLTVSSDMTWFTDGSNPLDIQSMVNGVTSYDNLGGNWFNASQTGYIRFDHGVGNSRVYTNSRYTYRTSTNEGTWKWQGSADASSWTDIGGNFTMCATANSTQQTDTHATMTANTTAYRYYQCVYVSGNQTNGGGRRMEMDFYGATIADNMVLVSTAVTALTAPTKGDIVLTWTDGVGTSTLNTDLTAEFSADNGSTWTSTTLVNQGTTGGHNIATINNASLTSTSGTSMRWRVKTLNQSISIETRLHAVSLGWS